MATKQKKNKASASAATANDIDLGTLLATPNGDREKLRDDCVAIARQQILTSKKYKDTRMQDVQKSIDLYNLITKKALKGRWNIPLPIMSGYVDTILSKTDDAPTAKFGHADIADMRRAAKVQAKFDQDSAQPELRWAEKDRQGKKIASFYGYSVGKYFAYNDAQGDYHAHFEIVDPLDFDCEPLGGQDLRNHKFYGQSNIFKTESALKGLATGASPVYDKKQVLRLIAAMSSNDSKQFERLYQEKTDRLRMLGFNVDTNNYVGVKVYSLTEWYMEHDGSWYYLLFEPHTGICVRFDELENVFDSNEGPFEVWHTHPDAFNFYSKSAADDMRPIAEGMNVIFNQMLDARERKTYAQRGYDAEMIEDPALLEYRPDGLIPVNTNGGARAIGSGIYEFKVEGMTEEGTINLMNFMDNVAGLKTGVTPSAQGESDEKRVGIYYGNLQQVADRLGLYNKSYSEFWARIARKFYFGLREHIQSNEMMVEMIGTRGNSWEQITKDDLNPKRDFNITIVGGQAQVQLDEIKKKTKAEALAIAVKLQRVNPDVATEEILRNGGWEEAQIKRLMDMESFGSDEIVSEAHQAIEDIILGKKVRENRGATPLFIQTIIDYAYDTEDLKANIFDALIAYAEQHVAIATENAMRKVRLQAAAIGGAADAPAAGAPVGGPTQIPGAPTPDSLSFNPEVGVTPEAAKAMAVNTPVQ